jgi:hypothetical protein
MVVASYGTARRTFHGVYAELDDGSYVTVNWCTIAELADEFPLTYRSVDPWVAHWSTEAGPVHRL